jgi:hypothetical protein
MPRFVLDDRILQALLLTRNGVAKREACSIANVCETKLTAAKKAFDTVPESVVPYLARIRGETDGLRADIALHSKRLQMQLSNAAADAAASNCYVDEKFS